MGYLSDQSGSYAAGVAYLAVSALVSALLILSVQVPHARTAA